jgi:hypothetical protein
MLTNSTARKTSRRAGSSYVSWLPAEDRTLAAWYGRESNKRLAARLPGRTAAAVRMRARMLGLPMRKKWSWGEVVLLGFYPAVGAAMLSEQLNRTPAAIRARANARGFKLLKAPRQQVSA